MSKRLAWSVLVAALLFNTGCASLLTGGPSRLDVEVAEPTDGTTILVRGLNNDDEHVQRGGTFQTRLDRRSGYIVTAVTPGRETEIVFVNLSPNWVYFLNLAPMVVGFVAATPLMFGPPNYNGIGAFNTVVTTSAALTIAGSAIDLFTGHAFWHDRQTIRLDLKEAPKDGR